MTKRANNLLGLFLNKVLGKNSPVNNTMIVESIVSAVTVNAASRPLNMVLSKKFAIKIPYITSTTLLPTSIVLTKSLG